MEREIDSLRILLAALHLHTQLPKHVAPCLTHYGVGALHDTVRTRAGPGRQIHRRDPLMFQQAFDTEDVIRVADGHATMQSVGPHDDSYSNRRLRGVGTLRLGDQVALGNSAMLQILAAHAAFAEAWIRRSTPGSNDDGSDPLAKELVGVIQPRAQYRRRTASIL